MKPFFSLCLLKLFLNNRLVSNTLLTEIVKSYKYFPHTSYYPLKNWPIICDAHKCKIFNSTPKNSLMNSTVLQRNSSRNELRFDNISPSRTTHFFISKWLKSSNSRWRANKMPTINIHPIRLWNICLHRKTHVYVDVLL